MDHELWALAKQWPMTRPVPKAQEGGKVIDIGTHSTGDKIQMGGREKRVVTCLREERSSNGK
jgi:hypothetical protein